MKYTHHPRFSENLHLLLCKPKERKAAQVFLASYGHYYPLKMSMVLCRTYLNIPGSHVMLVPLQC